MACSVVKMCCWESKRADKGFESCIKLSNLVKNIHIFNFLITQKLLIEN